MGAESKTNDERIQITQFEAVAFLTEFQNRVLQGYRLDGVPAQFPFGVFMVDMQLKVPWDREIAANKRRSSAGELPSNGPYTEAQMNALGFAELRKRSIAEYGITARSFISLKQQILKFYLEEEK